MITGAAGGHELDDQQGSAAPDVAATYDRLHESGGLVPARPVAQGSQVSRAHRRRRRG
jgi:hypothetical protein